MAKPYIHARNSIRRYPQQKLEFVRFLNFHTWMDLSKSAWAGPQHRCMLHHLDGAQFLGLLLGDAFANGLTHFEIARDHIQEDLGRLPILSEYWPEPIGPLARLVPAEFIAHKWKLPLADAEYLARLFNFGLEQYEQPRGWPILHHSLGPFLLSQIWGEAPLPGALGGVDTPPDSDPYSIRDVAEGILLYQLGKIPPFSDYCAAIRPRPWMSGYCVTQLHQADGTVIPIDAEKLVYRPVD